VTSQRSSEGLIPLLRRLWRHLSRRRQRQFELLLGLMVSCALAELVSLGAVVPFLGVMIAPERVLRNPLFGAVARAAGIQSGASLVLPFTLFFIVAAVVAGAIRLLFLWASMRFAFATGADLSTDMYRRTLYQSYPTHVARNSSEVISGITSKVHDGVTALNQVLLLLSALLTLVTITLALLLIDPLVATLASVGFGASYGVITWAYRRRLHVNSLRVAHEQTQVVKALQEGLGAIREVLLDGAQETYCRTYTRADRALQLARGSSSFIAGSPRFAMESLGLVLIAALAYGLSRQPGGITSALPGLGALALGAQRLLPALQQAYSAWAGIAGVHMSLAQTAALLEQPLPPEAHAPAPQPLPLMGHLRLDGVRFRYARDAPWVIDDLSLTINKGTRVGFVGSTGSGKSTLLDLLMGLLVPTEGTVLVDGQPLKDARVRAWQRTIAHVPQSIYLADTTMAENIAFGVPREAIDQQRVRHAARQAQIADLIESRPEGYDTVVGERGIRLSGGQRQRIGIARALYKQASVLVFDEATSALDNVTEQSVLDAIEGLTRTLTIVLIAHRLTTVRRCDVIVEMERGRLVAQGTYEQLLASSASFRRMAHAVG
jgi:ABC-type multidrug transport system fused ATPase/permease subunit